MFKVIINDFSYNINYNNSKVLEETINSVAKIY